MELFEARDHYIIQNGEHGLWCNRNTGTLTPKRGEDICLAWNPVCMGIVHGVIGKMKFHPESGWKLLLIRQHSLVGILPTGVEVNKIDKIFVLPLSMETQKDLQLDLCHKHHFGISKQSDLAKGEGKTLQKTWNSIKSAAENVKPKKLFNTAAWDAYVCTSLLASIFLYLFVWDGVQNPENFWGKQVLSITNLNHDRGRKVGKLIELEREIKEKERFERRIQEEVIRMFSEGENFYFTYKGDLTNTIQRLHSPGDSKTQAAWKNADDRFFWNKTMVDDLISSETELADPWIIPLVQGFVQIESCVISFEDEVLGGSVENVYTKSEEYDYQLCLISRRSRFRAGTRYRRRGVDETGSCANYVETEQILQFANHIISFVQVRGSVPLYWSQTGIKYKPPPRIDKDNEDDQPPFVDSESEDEETRRWRRMRRYHKKRYEYSSLNHNLHFETTADSRGEEATLTVVKEVAVEEAMTEVIDEVLEEMTEVE
ncbi:hypothetical protein CAPTEDRAFT_227829 [Capitella teleta]|uniref:SAC domain-containing protein n=1 Tax=Capitella teleta TaxID=283909 RepID=R7VGV9_CAPTE|nr:hypothetical protein CAPTEDRAFT_227829 [Capitella teleta]|eukprot:ELU14930.1 hypothetical protein CAPTEDRAFT_227829 [Capitella teleta]